MPKKFDTNPLDPDFPAKAREAETSALPKNNYQTAEFPPSSVTEEQTRRFDETNFNGYSAPFNGQNVPANFKATNADMNRSSNRKVAGVGLPENILVAVPYIPFFIGLVAGILELVFLPKSETKVRFHAAQGLAAHFAILIITTILGFADNFLIWQARLMSFFKFVTTVMLIIFAIKAWKGKPVHIESVDDLTEWLEDKIQPKH